MKRRDLEQRLQELGWRLLRHGGRHDIWERDGNEVVVPRHAEINEYTAKSILRQAGGSRR